MPEQIQNADNRLFSMESETLILSALLQSEGDRALNLLRGLRKKLRANDFHVEEHTALWGVLCAIDDVGEPIDLAAVADKARAMDAFIGGAEYLADLAGNAAASSAGADSIAAAAARVLDLAFQRQMKKALARALEMSAAGADFDTVASCIEDDVINLRRQREHTNAGPQHIKTFATKVLDQIVHVDAHGMSDFTFKTGHASFDEQTNGLQRGDLIVVAGRPSMGKTATMLYLANGVEAQSTPNLPVTPLIFSAEMSGDRLAMRQIAAAANVPVNSIRRAEMSDSQWDVIPDAVGAVSGRNIYIDDTPGISLPELRARAREHVTNHPNSPIFVDYMQIITVPTDASARRDKEERQKISDISRALKQLARELNVPVIALAQLNRDLEKRANKRPLLSDLRESGAIEQDADLIVFVYRDEVYNPDTQDRGIAEWIIGKQRDGATGTIRNGFIGQTMTYSDMGAYND